jgi:hypothetical protein
VLARIAAVSQTLASRQSAVDATRAEETAKVHQARAAQLQRLTERARRVMEAEAITLREGDRLMRDIVAGLAEPTDATPEVADAARALRALQEKVAPRVHDMREMDEWRRFANAQRQEQLIAMAEAIVLSLKNEAEAGKTSDLPATARALRELHAKWQEAADAPRQSAQKLWDRFRAATDFIRSAGSRMPRCGTSGAERAEAHGDGRGGRGDRHPSDWGKAAARFQELQKAWQSSARAPRSHP